MNASLFSSQPHDLHIVGDAPNLERVLQQIAESLKARSGTTPPATPRLDVPRSGIPFIGGEQAEELVQVEMGDRVYSLLCWFRHPEEEQPGLSPREREVARRVASGLPNKAIAYDLQISAWTVATYMRRIFTKLGVSSRAEMVAKALKEGLLMDTHTDAADR